MPRWQPTGRRSPANSSEPSVYSRWRPSSPTRTLTSAGERTSCGDGSSRRPRRPERTESAPLESRAGLGGLLVHRKPALEVQLLERHVLVSAEGRHGGEEGDPERIPA